MYCNYSTLSVQFNSEYMSNKKIVETFNEKNYAYHKKLLKYLMFFTERYR